jgi:hypothetical protein
VSNHPANLLYTGGGRSGAAKRFDRRKNAERNERFFAIAVMRTMQIRKSSRYTDEASKSLSRYLKLNTTAKQASKPKKLK